MPETETLIYNRYSILHIERSSSFSKVFFALDTYQNPPRSCVIKVFEPIVQKLKIARWIEREFQKEAKRLKQLSLNNPHLPEIYTYSCDFQVYYIVRELIEGETLEEKVKSNGKFSTQMVREILLKLLIVLDYLHQEQVIHQNIKPENIILRDEDNIPISIDFGNIKQIVSTYGFYGNKQIFSADNIYGYAPAEQALGKAVPASDLYSLGLTAVYLLTARKPIELAIDAKSNSFQLPEEVVASDPNLAEIISRAISSNIADRYNSASEMCEALLTPNSRSFELKTAANNMSQTDDRKSPVRHSWNWWKAIAYAMGISHLISMGIIAWYDWNLSKSNLVLQLPEPTEPTTSLPSIPPKQKKTAVEKPSILARQLLEPTEPTTSLPSIPPEQKKTAVEKPSILARQAKNSIEIPIFPTGSSKAQLRKALGEPSAIQQGYWANSSAWIYKQQADGSVDLGYLFDPDTDRLRQTEVTIAPSINLGTVEDVLTSLLRGEINPSIAKELQKVYNRQSTEYSFELKNLEGSIQREPDGHIYLRVWEADVY